MALEYSQPVDIVNRAGQHLGQPKITAADFQSATPASRLAAEAQTCYDKLRRANLRRNAWRFSIRRAILRAADDTTKVYTPPTWDVTAAYSLGYLVLYNGDIYQAQSGVAIGDVPNLATTWVKYAGPITALPWSAPSGAGQGYFTGELVYVSTTVYLSLISDNADAVSVATSWLQLPTGGALTTLQILYPIGAGPRGQTTTSNVFQLPYGYLRKAPTNPKARLDPPVGGPVYNQFEDWVAEGNYIVSQLPGPLMIRFASDVIDVPEMDAMFCEGLAVDMALSMCEAITQSKDKLDELRAERKRILGEARIVNGIEVDFVDPAEDEYLTVRL